MSEEKKKGAHFPERGRRLKELLDDEGLTPAEFVRRTELAENCEIAQKSLLSKIINGYQDLEDFRAKSWVDNFFPNVRYEYLMAIDDYKTQAEFDRAYLLNRVRDKYEMRITGMYEIANSLGFQIVRNEKSREHDANTLEYYFETRKAGYIVKKATEETVITENEYYALLADIADYVEMKLGKIIERGERRWQTSHR